MNVRTLTMLIFAYTTVEGLVINIMYPNTLPFIFKDFAILAAYLVLMMDGRGWDGSLGKVSGALAVYSLVIIFFLIMPSQVSLLGMLVAVKQRLFYIPLAWLGYHFVKQDSDVMDLARLMALTAIPACVFGIYLYFVGPSGLTSIGANYSAVFNSTAGEHGIAFWRVPGTFTSPGQYGGFLLFNSVLFAGLLLTPSVQARQRSLTLVALVVALGALMVSGSRSPVLFFLLCCLVILVVTGPIRGIGVWASGLYGLFTVGFSFFGDGVMDRVGSIASFEHVERFKDTYFGQLFWPMLWQSPMGFGLGRATLGARHFTDWANIMLVESYFGILVAETGLLGLAAFVVAIVQVIIALARCHFVMRTAPLNTVWYAVVLPVLITALLMPISTGIDAAPCNLYFWFFLGVSLKMYDLELLRLREGATATPTRATPWPVPLGPNGYPVSYQ